MICEASLKDLKAGDSLIRTAFTKDLSATAVKSMSREDMPITSGDLEAVGNLVRAVSVEGSSRNQLSGLKD